MITYCHIMIRLDNIQTQICPAPENNFLLALLRQTTNMIMQNTQNLLSILSVKVAAFLAGKPNLIIKECSIICELENHAITLDNSQHFSSVIYTHTYMNIIYVRVCTSTCKVSCF